MTEDQETKCHAIIHAHAHAIAAGAGNAVPVPGLGIAADMVTMTSMCMSLCAVFGGNITWVVSGSFPVKIAVSDPIDLEALVKLFWLSNELSAKTSRNGVVSRSYPYTDILSALTPSELSKMIFG